MTPIEYSGPRTAGSGPSFPPPDPNAPQPADNPVAPLTPQEAADREQQASHEPYIERVLVAADKTIATVAGATPDTTISADAGIASYRDHGFKGLYGRWMSRFLDLFQKNHGAKAVAGDLAQAQEAEQKMKESGLLP